MLENNDLDDQKNVQLHLRMDKNLHDSLVDLAKNNERSLNKQVLFMLNQQLKYPSPTYDEKKVRTANINSVIDTMVSRDFSR